MNFIILFWIEPISLLTSRKISWVCPSSSLIKRGITIVVVVVPGPFNFPHVSDEWCPFGTWTLLLGFPFTGTCLACLNEFLRVGINNDMSRWMDKRVYQPKWNLAWISINYSEKDEDDQVAASTKARRMIMIEVETQTSVEPLVEFI